MKSEPEKSREKKQRRHISRISISGYKSIYSENSVEVRPLTILAGANSSGKSSIIQPLLLLKQTLEASYDPGPLKLSGPNVRYSSGEQMLCKTRSGEKKLDLEIKISLQETTITSKFRWIKKKGFEIVSLQFEKSGNKILLTPDIDQKSLESAIPSDVKQFIRHGDSKDDPAFIFKLGRDRCFFEIYAVNPKSGQQITTLAPSGLTLLKGQLRSLIHLPGLRGNPERSYPVTAVGTTFQGTFQEYTASVIYKWQTDKCKELIEAIGQDMEALGLTWKVAAIRQNDTQVELQVGRMPHAVHAGAHDLVNIADVGLGISQTLPVIVALRVAKPGQLVFLEQPEIHLHPRAQKALADILVGAANRGVIVIVETHSSLLIRRIQTRVAHGDLSPEKVSLNWFRRDLKTGRTRSCPGKLDATGAFGDWPEDFDEITLETEQEFLDAHEAVINRHAVFSN